MSQHYVRLRSSSCAGVENTHVRFQMLAPWGLWRRTRNALRVTQAFGLTTSKGKTDPILPAAQPVRGAAPPTRRCRQRRSASICSSIAATATRRRLLTRGQASDLKSTNCSRTLLRSVPPTGIAEDSRNIGDSNYCGESGSSRTIASAAGHTALRQRNA